MSFGWSAGDIAECVKILIKIGQALKESGGSTDEYRHAVDFLKGVETTVRGVEAIFLNHPDLTFQPAFQEHTTNLITAITHFRRKTEGYESSLGDNPTTSGAKKAWKKIKLALFGHIEELKSDILYPQSIVNNLIGLQALDILVTVSKKPTLSPQQFQDSAEAISREFPILVARIDELRTGIAEELVTIQQTVEANAQRNFDQIQQDLSEGNNLQQSSFARAQADSEAQDIWRTQVRTSITEIQAEAQKSFEALQEVKQAQETYHQNNMQTLELFSWRNAYRPVISRPIISRPVVKVIRKTVIVGPRPSPSTPATGAGSSRGGNSQGGNSRGGGASSQGNTSRGKNSRGGSSRGGGPRNAPGGENSRGDSLGASASRGGLSKGGSNPRKDDSHKGSSKGTSSRGGGNPRGGDSHNGSSSRGGVNSRGGDAHKGSSKGASSGGGANSRGGNSHGGNSRGGSSKEGSRRGNSGVKFSREGLSGGKNVQGGSARGGSARGGSMRGGSARGGGARGGGARGGGARGGGVQGINVRGEKTRRLVGNN